MSDVTSFQPPWYLRNGHVQTILASSPFRAWGKNPMCDAARELILKTSGGVSLQGFYSPLRSERARGLVILLHGWEGSVESTYISCTGKVLYQRGYDVFRLNFRDHGDTYHLNSGIFYAVLLEEVFEAVDQVARMVEDFPVFLVGFSLGGNFSLRIAREMLHTPIANLRHVAAISPVLDPAKATTRTDRHPLFRRYFLKKWRRSMMKKQELFPDSYDFADVLCVNTIQGATDRLLEKYTAFKSAREYFEKYSILGDAIKKLSIPTTIITAKDDPIIPVEDFYQLELNESTNLVIHAHGGHNGFVDGIFFKGWYEQKLADLFDTIVIEAGRRGSKNLAHS